MCDFAVSFQFCPSEQRRAAGQSYCAPFTVAEGPRRGEVVTVGGMATMAVRCAEPDVVLGSAVPKHDLNRSTADSGGQSPARPLNLRGDLEVKNMHESDT